MPGHLEDEPGVGGVGGRKHILPGAEGEVWPQAIGRTVGQTLDFSGR